MHVIDSKNENRLQAGSVIKPSKATAQQRSSKGGCVYVFSFLTFYLRSLVYVSRCQNAPPQGILLLVSTTCSVSCSASCHRCTSLCEGANLVGHPLTIFAYTAEMEYPIVSTAEDKHRYVSGFPCLPPHCTWRFASKSRNNSCTFPHSGSSCQISSSTPCIAPEATVDVPRY